MAQRAIERALAAPGQTLVAPNDAVPARTRPRMVGSSPAIQEVFKRIAVVAPTEACVHIRGESGTGKELVAHAIHQYSRRAGGPFVPVNVASLSPFAGRERAFWARPRGSPGRPSAPQGAAGAGPRRHALLQRGRRCAALDQVKLLRVLEYGDILPVARKSRCRATFA